MSTRPNQSDGAGRYHVHFQQLDIVLNRDLYSFAMVCSQLPRRHPRAGASPAAGSSLASHAYPPKVLPHEPGDVLRLLQRRSRREIKADQSGSVRHVGRWLSSNERLIFGPLLHHESELTSISSHRVLQRALTDGLRLQQRGADRSRRPFRLDNKGPVTTYLSVTVIPAVTGSPVEPEKSRAARAGLLHARAISPRRACAHTASEKRKSPGTVGASSGICQLSAIASDWGLRIIRACNQNRPKNGRGSPSM